MIQIPFTIKERQITPPITSNKVIGVSGVIDYSSVGIPKATIKVIFENQINEEEIVLWENDDYTNIGNWTDNDVETRLLQILNS